MQHVQFYYFLAPLIVFRPPIFAAPTSISAGCWRASVRRAPRPGRGELEQLSATGPRLRSQAWPPRAFGQGRRTLGAAHVAPRGLEGQKDCTNDVQDRWSDLKIHFCTEARCRDSGRKGQEDVNRSFALVTHGPGRARSPLKVKHLCRSPHHGIRGSPCSNSCVCARCREVLAP